MQKKISIVLVICALICCCYGSVAFCKNKISIGEAFEIACKDASNQYSIDLKNYDFIIFVNAPPDEMLNIQHSSVTKREAELFKKLEYKKYAAIEYLDKRIRGTGHGIVTTYYIDLSTGEIIDIYRAI